MVGKPLERVQELNRKEMEQLKTLLLRYVSNNYPQDDILNKQSHYIQEHISATLNVKLWGEDPAARAAGE